MARQDGANLFGAREGLVQFHARAARIGENGVDTLPLERFYQNVTPQHGRAHLGALLGLGRGSFFCRCAHIFLLFSRAVRVNKKPTTVSSRGFLSKFRLRSTRTNGVANYDDQQYLSNINKHWLKLCHSCSTGQGILTGSSTGLRTIVSCWAQAGSTFG